MDESIMLVLSINSTFLPYLLQLLLKSNVFYRLQTRKLNSIVECDCVVKNSLKSKR